MKKTIGLLLMSLVMISANSQSLNMNVYHSTGKQTGVNVFKTTELGFIYGAGASYNFATYTGENSSKYQEIANHVLPANGNDWPVYYKQSQYKSFKENRATLKLLFGYDYGKTSIVINAGISFRSEYWCAKDGPIPIGSYDPVNRYFYTFKNISPIGLVGVNMNHRLSKRFGLMAGWNNVEKFTYGIAYRITPTKLFNW